MQFYTGYNGGVTYGAKDKWQDALHHEGSGQMGMLKGLIMSVDYQNGVSRDDLVIGGQREKYGRIAVFAADDFMLAYSFTGNEFALDTSNFHNADAWYFSPSNGVYSYVGKVTADIFEHKRLTANGADNDIVILIKKQ